MEVPMNDLTPEDEALLASARRFEGTANDRARVKRKLFARIGIGLGVSSVSAASASAAPTAWASTAKIVVALAVGAGAGTGVVVAYDARTAREPPAHVVAPPIVSSTAASVPRDPPTATVDIEPLAPPPVERGRARPAAPPPLPMSDEPSPRAGEPAALAAPNATTKREPAGPATVAAEADLLRRADGALKAGNPSLALALLGEHLAKFPNGILIEEREAERIVVLCALGRTDEARAAAAEFRLARPRSPLLGRVRESCGGG
jgi:hypothetical protein